MLARVGPVWASTMRLADPLGLHRTAVGLVRGTQPAKRDLLMRLPVDRSCLVGALGDGTAGRAELVA
ncbi:hypothetical protein [Streptomyces sp. NBC_00083]|uniref:hypothetical protein n=1 Tax=Streptomyces sp. NBC_00083 TaxID=2975647 RepID=UPI0022533552|nr:hypothetical protein [Streptomyces sp. NBC_00083]MCX5384214.1 hypothetical protein [Streptomyces sp. NBC_00083]